MNHVHGTEKVCADTVHFVDETNTGNTVVVRLAPYGFGLGFHTGNRVKNCDGAVENTQGTFHFDSEVNVSRSINDIDGVSFPCALGCSGSDGDTAFLFLLHEVHGSAAVVGFTDFM